MDERNYAVAAQMLLGLGVDRVELLTNNPDKAAQLRAAGVHIDRCLPTALNLSPANAPYLAAKACRGHQLLEPAERELGYASGSTDLLAVADLGPGR